jgi:hypothetical protein
LRYGDDNIRDYIYGILGLNDYKLITVDYSKPAFLIYRDLVLDYIAENQDLDVLAACKYFDTDHLLWKQIDPGDAQEESQPVDSSSVFHNWLRIWNSTQELEPRPGTSRKLAEATCTNNGMTALPS